MTVVKRARETNFSCEQMYALVDDIEAYHEFLPYFSKGVVHSRDENIVEATLEVEAAGMTKSFTTRNHLQADKMIELRLVDGPFSHLGGFWRFDATDAGSVISLDLEFEFSGKMMSLLLGPVFEQVTDKMVDAFCERAEALYGAG
ncbi:MAG: type II toxin-antitoxin system RatA family toxin [Gammaproteobacteria bacterium]|nr:type II toxin-antitoxin system RatA family toxin [Gammaproteobacteria bacterium]MCH9717549.1 type II toxin-antitoxin system RatA family toxin [Gammaproteobacteria bacterium]MCH9764101.1 type II toxin-antitoxin system RatA family toxin [Gammaproteobacteria bacterium]